MVFKIRKFAVASILLALMLIAGCAASTDSLANDVRSSIEESLKADGISVKSFVLTHRGGNEYKGILETKEAGGDFTYTVEVIYDGKNFAWEIVN